MYGYESGVGVVQEKEVRPTATDVAVIRPPLAYAPDHLDEIVKMLAAKNFYPLLLPQIAPDYYVSDKNRWYPTDSFREVGPYIIVNDTDNTDSVLQFLKGKLSNQQLAHIQSRIRNVSLKGGDYVHNTKYKKLLYAYDQMYESTSGSKRTRDDYNARIQAERNSLTQDLLHLGWDILPVATKGVYLQPKPGAQKDLDFLLSIFSGNDSKLHAITAETFTPALASVNSDIVMHSIPDQEASLGGCNIADLRNGQVLIAPHMDDAPTTNEILERYAAADIIQVPSHFLSGGGGPRCSISSFSL